MWGKNKHYFLLDLKLYVIHSISKKMSKVEKAPSRAVKS